MPGEFFERFAKARPGGLGLEQDVVAALQRHEMRAGYCGRERAPLRIGNARVIPAVDDQRRDRNGGKSVHDIDVPGGFDKPRGDFRL